MTLSRNRLYSIILIACFAGYIWLLFGFASENTFEKPLEACIVKNITTIPCPSCGSTRAIIALAKGNVIEALHINPMGFLVAFIMFFAPLWILADLLTSRRSLFDFYQKIETNLKNPKIAVPLILLVVLLWVWNITKGL
jgi:hypothetical protein